MCNLTEVFIITARWRSGAIAVGDSVVMKTVVVQLTVMHPRTDLSLQQLPYSLNM